MITMSESMLVFGKFLWRQVWNALEYDDIPKTNCYLCDFDLLPGDDSTVAIAVAVPIVILLVLCAVLGAIIVR